MKRLILFFILTAFVTASIPYAIAEDSRRDIRVNAGKNPVEYSKERSTEDNLSVKRNVPENVLGPDYYDAQHWGPYGD